MSLEYSNIGDNTLRSYKNSPRHNQQSQSQQVDQDPFRLNSLYEIFQGISDWRNIQDIIRTTFRSMFDSIKLQSDAILNLEHQMQQKVSKQEFSNQINQKANSYDINRSFADIMQSLDNKLSFEECKAILKEEQHISEKNIWVEVNQKLDEVQILNSRQIQTEIQIIQQQLLTKPSLTEMTELLEGKVNKQQFQTAISKKVDKLYLEEQMNTKVDKLEHMNLLGIVENKAEINQIEKIANILEIKCDKNDLEIQQRQLKSLSDELKQKNKDIHTDFERIKQELEKFKYEQSTKLDTHEFNKLQKQFTSQQSKQDLIQVKSQEIQQELEELSQNLKVQKQQMDNTIYQKNVEDDQQFQQIRDEINKVSSISNNNYNEIRMDLESNTTLMRNINNTLKQDIISNSQMLTNEIEKAKIDINESKLLLEKDQNQIVKIQHTLEEKVDLEEVQSALNTCQQDISQKFIELKHTLENQIKLQEQQLLDLLQRKVTVNDMHELLSQKVDQKVLESQLVVKANRKELDQVIDQLNQVFQQVERKLDISEYQVTFKNCLNDLTEMRQEIAQKGDYAHLNKIISEKADFEELQSVVKDIKYELDRKAYQENINKMHRDQAIINESLCTENIVGRWMWKSGHVKTGSLIPWELQIVNTLPDNFLWEKDKSSILVCAPGLYEVIVGFFSLKKPGIQIQINGEPIISAVQKQEQASKTIKQHKHTQGQLTGLNIREVIIVPQRSRISVMYSGDSSAEGFISLKRL